MNHTKLFEQDDEWKKLKNGLIKLSKTEVLSRFRKVIAVQKNDGSALTEADTQMQLHMARFLQKNWQQFALLSEETSSHEQQQALDNTLGCWVLDPVDGTNNFANGIPYFSISLALIIKGNIVLGLVYDPSRNELFAARKGLGAELNDIPIKPQVRQTTIKSCIANIDFKRLKPTLAKNLAINPPYCSQRSFGSVALDWCWLATGRNQIYCHGSQHLWDYAAGWIILQESGGISKTLNGEQVYVKTLTKRSTIASTNSKLFQLWQEQIIQLQENK